MKKNDPRLRFLTPEERLEDALESGDNARILEESVIYVAKKVSLLFPGTRVKGIFESLGKIEYGLFTGRGRILVRSEYSAPRMANIFRVCVNDPALHGACEEAVRLSNEPGYTVHSFPNQDRTEQLVY